MTGLTPIAPPESVHVAYRKRSMQSTHRGIGRLTKVINQYPVDPGADEHRVKRVRDHEKRDLMD